MGAQGRLELVTQEVQNTVQEVLFSKDGNLLKEGKHIENQQHLATWKF